jgi:putative PIN family toxin of toxin-antitoxin system
MGARVVLDTNILVSALGWRGAPHQIVRSCLDHRHELLLSPDLLEEVERVLHYPKFSFSSAEITDYLALLMEAAEMVSPDFRLAVIEADPTDDRILECALAGGAEVIVSGDGHILSLKNFEGIPILRPQEFLDRYRQE